MEVELACELRLAKQHNLHEFLRGRLQVREHAQIFQGLDRHVLGLVDDQRHVPALFVLLEQCLVETVDQLEQVIFFEEYQVFQVQTEFLEHQLQQAAKRNVGVEDINGP